MAWSDWSEYDTANLVGGALGIKLSSAAEEVKALSADLNSRAVDGRARADAVLALWRQHDAKTVALDSWGESCAPLPLLHCRL